MSLEIQVLSWDRDKHVAGLNRLMGLQPSRLDKWISNSNTYIIQRLKNLHRLASTQQTTRPQGLGASEKKFNKKYYIILQGGELTCFHVFKSSC